MRTPQPLIEQLTQIVEKRPEIQVAILFGSLAEGQGRPDSDLDLAIQMAKPISVEQKINLIGELATLFGRPVDLVDLRDIGQPLLGEILAKGTLIQGSAAQKGDLVFRSIMLQEDFAPYQKRILEERRKAWIES